MDFCQGIFRIVKDGMTRVCFFALLLLPLWLGISLKPAAAAPAPMLRVTFLQVGFGNATLLRDGTGFDVLIDGGDRSAGEKVLSYLRWVGVDDLEVVVATHPDRDHIGGLINVLESQDMPVESLLYNGCAGDTATWSDLVEAVTKKGLTLTKTAYPDRFDWGNATASTLHPAPEETCADDNRASVVLRLDYAQVSWLFTGDIDAFVEAGLIASGRDLRAPILQVPHHGSDSSSSPAFLSAVEPEQAIISVGNNGYGLPDPQAIQGLEAAGARVWRSDFQGSIVTASDGQVYRIFNPRALLPALLQKY